MGTHKNHDYACVYAPTEDSTETGKENCYDDSQEAINRIPHHDIKVLMGACHSPYQTPSYILKAEDCLRTPIAMQQSYFGCRQCGRKV